MEISVSMLDGQKLSAKFGEHEVISDQSINAGGSAEHPEPFDYFLVAFSYTCCIIGLPQISASGLPGKRVEA